MKNFNMIQINGLRGILMACGICVCLAAGFIVFPGFVMKSLWNVVANFTGMVPSIALVQGVLLWAIMVIGYMVFRKNPMFIEFRSSRDLSEEEMNAVMKRIKIQQEADIIARSMMEAQREFERKCAENSVETKLEKKEKNHIDI